MFKWPFRSSSDGNLFQIVAPSQPGNGELFFQALHGLLPPALRRFIYGTPRVSLEMVGTGHQDHFRMFAPRAQAASVERFLRASYPGVQVVPEDDAELRALPVRACAAVQLRSLSYLPIHIEPRVEPLTPLLAVLAEPGQREAIEIQLLVSPISTAWLGRAMSYAGRLRLGGRDFLDVLLGHEGRRTPTHWALIRAAQIESKAEKLPFACFIRVLIRADVDHRAHELLRDVAAGLRPFAGPNSFDFRRVLMSSVFERQFLARRMPLLGRFVLNTEELAALWHMPDEPPVHLLASRSLRLAPPLAVPRAGRVFGVATAGRGQRPVAQALPDARMHTVLTGPTGTGKSTLLLNLILQDLEAGRGVAVLDPKSDLITAVLDRLPRKRIGDTVLISPRENERMIGVNPLYFPHGEEPIRLAEHAVAAFQRVYANFWGPRTEEVLRSALLTLIHHPGATLAHVPKLLTDSAFRREVVARIDDPIGVGSFWRWYEQMTDAQRTEAIAPLLNRLRAFVSLPRVRRLLCQPRSTIDVGKVMQGGGVLLVDLAEGLWGSTTARLVGSLLFTSLWQHAQRRAALPEGRRRDFPPIYR